MRIGKATLKLSLVSCPVALFPASTEREKISFRQINKKTGNRIKYRKVDAETGDEVDSSDVVKGYCHPTPPATETSRDRCDRRDTCDNPITMGILAVTRAAETCDRCDNPSHACRGGGLSVGQPTTVSRARQKCRPHPTMDRPPVSPLGSMGLQTRIPYEHTQKHPSQLIFG